MTTALTPYHRGMNLLESFRDEMEDLFDRVVGEGHAMKGWAPRVDLEETVNEFLVNAYLPGVDPKDVDIQVVDNALTIRGGKEETKEEKKKNYRRLERLNGQFHRAISLPAGADADTVNATSANCVVTITIPKRPGAQPKRIPVQPKVS